MASGPVDSTPNSPPPDCCQLPKHARDVGQVAIRHNLHSMSQTNVKDDGSRTTMYPIGQLRFFSRAVGGEDQPEAVAAKLGDR